MQRARERVCVRELPKMVRSAADLGLPRFFFPAMLFSSSSTLTRALRPLISIRLNSSNIPAAPAPTSTQVTPSQAPNYPEPWSTNQRIRPGAASGPRFEQTAMEYQPNPPSAMALLAEEPIRVVHARKAVCDGGTARLASLRFLLIFAFRRRRTRSSKDIHQPCKSNGRLT